MYNTSLKILNYLFKKHSFQIKEKDKKNFFYFKISEFNIKMILKYYLLFIVRYKNFMIRIEQFKGEI